MIRYIKIIILFFVFESTYAQDYKKHFVNLKDFNSEIEIDLKYFKVDNFTSKRVPGYNSNNLLVSLPTAKAILKAQKEFIKLGYSLIIYDGYRPQRAVDFFCSWTQNFADTITKSKYYPNLKKELLLKQGYIASKSGHSRGSTLDVGLVYSGNGKLVDMGTIFDFFGKESWTNSTLVTKEQLANRQLLKYVMEQCGFVNFSKEWWHYTLKNEPYPNTYFNFEIE